MRQSSHLGTFIREEIFKPRHLTITAAARLLGVNRPNLSNLINGKISLSKEMAAKFEQSFEISAEKLLAMQLEFDSEKAVDEFPRVKARPYVAPFLEIHANDIELSFSRWIDMRAKLAVFLRILIHSTTAHISKIDFPGYEDSQRPGWDGWLESPTGSAWVPQGFSGWEFGVNGDFKTKANKDFQKSVKENSEDKRLSTVFVFVTPRRWPGKKDWVDKKKKLNLWKDVIVYDSSDLEQWVENSIEAQVWLANQNRIPSFGVKTLQTCWEEWANVTAPFLPKELFLSQIQQNEKKIKDFLVDSGKTRLIIAADSVEEGLAFVSCSFDHLPEYKNRILVFDKQDVLPKLLLGDVNFIPVIHTQEVEKDFAPYSSRVKAILIYPRNYVLEPDIQLEPLDCQSFKKAFQSGSDNEEDWIDEQYKRSAGSLTVLRRQLATLPTVQKPEWADKKELVDRLIPLMLVGVWNEKNESDKELLSLLADKSYDKIEKDINELLSLNDSPLWSIGYSRGVISKIDSLFAVSRYITTTQLEAFFEIAKLVLSEDDPALDLPECVRWSSLLYGKTREFSEQLREGIGETFVLLAVYGDLLFGSSRALDCGYRASRIVENILLPLDSRNLEANCNELPVYAEAAPSTFLRLIEDDLKNEQPQVLALLRPVETGYFGASCPRVGLLRALELLAWNSDFLPRVATILAQMCQYEIKDNWANKPIFSLSQIFDKWMPQTAASSEERIAIFEQIFVRYPKVAWQIAIQQFTITTWVGHYTYRPKWRRDSYNHGLNPNVEEGKKFMEYVFSKVINRKHYSVDMLGDLVSKLRAMNANEQAKVWGVVENWLSDGQSDEDLAVLREKIRVTVLSKNVRNSAQKLGFAEFSAKALEVYKKLQPKNVVLKNMWLFKNPWVRESANESIDEETDYRKRDKYIQELRVNALFEIVQNEGLPGIVKLAQMGNASYVIGSLLAEAWVIDVSDIKKIIIEENVDDELIRGMLDNLDVVHFNRIANELFTRATNSQFLRFLLLSRYDKNTWDIVEKAPADIKTNYWFSVKPSYRYFDLNDFEFGAKKLLAANRPDVAFNSVELEIEKISPQLVYQLLKAIPESLSKNRIDEYALERALKVINDSHGFTLEQKANLEMLHIRQLSEPRLHLIKSPIPNLEKYVEQHPEFFATAVCEVYKRDDLKDESDLVSTVKDSTGYHLLLETLRHTPGYVENNVVNSIQKLLDWSNQVIEICQTRGRYFIAYRCVGQLLSRSTTGKDGIWPNEQVRGFLEKVDQEDLINSMVIGKYNSRGPVWRDKGGRQEWKLSKQYANWAEELKDEGFTVAARMLSALVNIYEKEAEEFDMREKLELRLAHN